MGSFALLTACGASAARQTAPGPLPSRAAATADSAPASTARGSTAPSPSPTPDPGRLPQTRASPTAVDPAFLARMRSFWAGVVGSHPTAALPAFFPLGAYRQVKALRDPAADWRDRLVSLYDLDLRALHARVGAGATLLGVDVPAAAATWVRPGEESNRIGYWRVYGTRVRYRAAAGREGSFGIFSLISWRGQWYVVHLGPISRAPGTAAVTP